MIKVRLGRTWYDGPQVTACVELDGVYVPYGETEYADEIHQAGDEWDPDDWPEGDYELRAGRLEPLT